MTKLILTIFGIALVAAESVVLVNSWSAAISTRARIEAQAKRERSGDDELQKWIERMER